MRRARAGLQDPRKPVGGFLFIGPSGVGKTELAHALAHALFGTDDALVRLDLSEFTEQHTISRLLGAPPGYAGHDEPGQLTEPIRRRPYSVVLFDEIEKAHPDVAAMLLQILDDGRVTDAKGRAIDFRHAIVVLTSNLDREELRSRCAPNCSTASTRSSLRRWGCRRSKRSSRFRSRAGGAAGRTRRAARLTEDARRFLADESMAAGDGARNVQRTISRHVATPLSGAILRGVLHAGSTAGVDLHEGMLVVRAA